MTDTEKFTDMLLNLSPHGVQLHTEYILNSDWSIIRRTDGEYAIAYEVM